MYRMMSKYGDAEVEGEDSSSIGTVAPNSDTISGLTYIQYRSREIWKTRTLLEKFLLVFSVVLLVTVIATLATLLSYKHQLTRLDDELHRDNCGIEIRGVAEETYCLTKECAITAASIIQSVNPSINPCYDFYEYACGGWSKQNPIPEEKSVWGTFSKLEQNNQLIIKHVLERPDSEMRSEAEKKAKAYYTSCMDDNRIETLGAKPMLDLLATIGGWNITGQFDVSKWTLQNSLHVLHNIYNTGGLFSWVVSEDDRNSSQYIIQIDQGGLTLPTAEIYLNTTHEKVLAAYLEYMTKIGVLLGGEETSTRRQMNDIIEFETKIAEITTPIAERRNEEKLYTRMSLIDLQLKAPMISWVKYFQDAARLVNKQISEKTQIVNFAPEHFVKLSKLVLDYNNTLDGKIILNNYLVWHMVKTLAPSLSKPFREAHKGLRRALLGSNGTEGAWRYCVDDVNNAMGFAVGAMFVREAFHGKSKPMAQDMINRVRGAFTENLKHVDWMDAETREAAKQKANAITDMIGFPDYILKANELDERYSDLTITPNEYFQNNIQVMKYNLRKNLEKLGQKVNKNVWVMSPPTVNAYYTPTKNQMVFPAGILQSPFYSRENPNSVNFGGIGVVMGHELTHAFDDQGRQFDMHGNLHQWWNNVTTERFKKRTECFVEQYNQYQVNGHSINGRQTLGENIADNGGLRAAYRAFTSMPNYRKDLLLPGVNLTHTQLFFLSFAQIWCSTSTAETVELQLENDFHSPPRFRVIGPLSNMREFANAFNCKNGSKMNPIKKCDLW